VKARLPGGTTPREKGKGTGRKWGASPIRGETKKKKGDARW